MTADIQTVKMMASASQRREFSLSRTAERFLLAVSVLGLYGLLMQRYPIIYGGDTVIRLVNYPRILFGHQLPLLQVLIYLVMRWYFGPTGIFTLMALISAAACAGMHALAGELTQDRCAARLTAILFATHPFILYYSRVPYQEPLLLAGMAWGLYYLFRKPSALSLLLSSLFLGVACLSRYEGWIAALGAALFLVRQNVRRQGRTRVPQVVQPLLLFGWAPAVWIAWNRGLSPGGSFILDLGFHVERFYRSYFIVKSTLWWTESAVALLAVIGFAYVRLDRRLRGDERFPVLLWIVALLLAALVFSAHGIQPNPNRIVTEREAFVPISILMIYAGIGGSRLMGEFRRMTVRNPMLRVGIPTLGVLAMTGYSLSRGVHRVAAANEDPELKTDYQVARFLAERQGTALILAVPLPTEQFQSFLQGAEKWSGFEGREKAEQSLKNVETTPLDYQRVLVFSWAGRNKILSADHVRGLGRSGIEESLRRNRVDYLVVFSDFTPDSERERIILSYFAGQGAPEFEIRNGNKAARIFPAARY
jgi:hypothetical protein